MVQRAVNAKWRSQPPCFQRGEVVVLPRVSRPGVLRELGGREVGGKAVQEFPVLSTGFVSRASLGFAPCVHRLSL